MFDAKAFGERLAQERREKAARERRDVTRTDVAEAVGLSSAAISNYELGKSRNIAEDIITRLAEYFGVRASWLRYGEGERAAPTQRRLVPDTRGEKATPDRRKRA